MLHIFISSSFRAWDWDWAAFVFVRGTLIGKMAPCVGLCLGGVGYVLVDDDGDKRRRRRRRWNKDGSESDSAASSVL